MGKLIGIDLGTTFSAAAHVNEHGKPELIPNAESDRLTPSAILFDDETTVVGKYAVQGSKGDPKRFVAFMKRNMGKPASEFSKKFGGKKYSADELSAMVLKKIKQDVEAEFQTEVTDAVITVPAYFGEVQRAATTNAGTIAGLNVLQLVNEPTAAAIAYGIDKLGRDQRVFVFDLGGGTFDVTIMEVTSSGIRMIQTNGDPHLGGRDWDNILSLHVADRFNAEHNVDPLAHSEASQELQLQATAAKEALSQREKTRIVCHHGGKSTTVPVTRSEFEEMARKKVNRCRELCGTVMRDADLDWPQIDTVLLVGGSTRMPMVQNMLRELTGKEINPRELNPDEAVALGAALHGTFRQITENAPESAAVATAVEARYGSSNIQIVDGASHSLGTIALSDGNIERNFVLIPKMEPVPCKKTKTFSTIEQNQRRVVGRVTQGLPDGQAESDNIKFDKHTIIGKVTLDLPPGLPAHSPLEVTYEYTADQTLEVSVKGPDGRVGRTTIERSTLNPKEVAEATEAMKAMNIE